LIAIGIESKYRYVARSLSGRGPKGEPNTLIVAKSKTTNILRRLKLIWRSDSSMIAFGVELEYRSVAISLSGWGSKVEPNAPIVTESEVADFLR
jgi:hypothetical protein